MLRLLPVSRAAGVSRGDSSQARSKAVLRGGTGGGTGVEPGVALYGSPVQSWCSGASQSWITEKPCRSIATWWLRYRTVAPWCPFRPNVAWTLSAAVGSVLVSSRRYFWTELVLSGFLLAVYRAVFWAIVSTLSLVYPGACERSSA